MQRKNHAIVKNMDLLRNLAWSFHNTTGIEFDELLSEAIQAWYKARATYKPGKGTKFTSWAYNIMRNHLINFCKKERSQTFGDIELAWNEGYEMHPFFEFLDELSDNARKAVQFIISNPQEYAGISPKAARGLLTEQLRTNGWKWQDIWGTINELKVVFN